MRATLISASLLLTLAPAAHSASLAADSAAGPFPPPLASLRLGWQFPDRVVHGSPMLAAPSARYTAQPSGLDRIDPANLRLLGGEIGGNGVQGGAVVSLTWPTEP